MTTTEPNALICPNCASTNTAIGGSGSAICTDCAHLWNPNDVQYPPTPIYVPPVQATVEEVFGTPFDHVQPGDDYDPDEMIGGTATLEGGQLATVVAFTASESVIVALSTGDLAEVPMSDVERIVPPVVIPDPVEIPDDVDAMPADMQLALTLAQVIIRAGCESVTGTGASVTPGVPPVGYLPSDEALHSVVERAAGLAVGMLIEAFELDVDEILTFVGATDDEVQVATETTEETTDEHTSDNE